MAHVCLPGSGETHKHIVRYPSGPRQMYFAAACRCERENFLAGEKTRENRDTETQRSRRKKHGFILSCAILPFHSKAFGGVLKSICDVSLPSINQPRVGRQRKKRGLTPTPLSLSVSVLVSGISLTNRKRGQTPGTTTAPVSVPVSARLTSWTQGKQSPSQSPSSCLNGRLFNPPRRVETPLVTIHG